LRSRSERNIFQAFRGAFRSNPAIRSDEPTNRRTGENMPRTAATPSIDAIVRDAMEGVVKRASAAIAKAIAELAAARLDEELQGGVARARGRGARPRSRGRPTRRPRAEITKWVADNRARRVPNFVIEMTGGLDTKKKIVARFGENAAFERGKPLPKARG
jgi:hypothetical protein